MDIRKNLNVSLNFSLFSNLYAISVGALLQTANTLTLINLPPTLKSISLVVNYFDLNDILLLNNSIEIIRIHAETFVYSGIVDIRKYTQLHALVLRASN